MHPALDRWLNQQEALRNQAERRSPVLHTSLYASTSADDFVHVVVLEAQQEGDTASRWLTLWPGRARKLKGKPGELGKVQLPSHTSRYTTPFSAPLVPAGRIQGLLCHWHQGQMDSRWQDGVAGRSVPHHAVRDELGVYVLEQAVQAGEVVQLTSGRTIGARLSWGEPRAVQWVWRSEPHPDDGEPGWRLLPDLGSPQAYLCLGDPLLYVDTGLATVGTVQPTGVHMDTVRHWLQLPHLPEAWMRQHAIRLRALVPHLPPAVASELGREVRGVAPTPCLHVSSHPRPDRAMLRLQLGFDYAGDHEGVRGHWPAEAPACQVIETPQGRVQLWRELGAEAEARNQLTQAGYLPVGRHDPGAWEADPGRWPNPFERDLDQLRTDFAAWRAAGWRVTLAPALQAAIDRVGEVDIGLRAAVASTVDGAVDGAADPLREPAVGELKDGGWFDLTLGFVIGAERINLLPLMPQLVRQWAHWEVLAQTSNLPWPTHVWLHDPQGQPLRLPTAPLRPWLATLHELVGEHPEREAGDVLRLSRFDALQLTTGPGSPSGAALQCSDETTRALGQLVAALSQPDGVPMAPLPQGLQATLRPYQRQGYSWLQHLRAHGLGGVLADDMGLGKTLQAIAHLLAEQQAGRLSQPALIVVPTSLVGNWRSELQRFAPSLRTLVLHGQDRHAHHDTLAQHDVVITTYPLLLRDERVLTAQRWAVVILDEAQAIKNARTRQASVVQDLRAGQRLCLSGTPMENHLGEIWSLFHFLMPGYLGHELRFKQVLRTPIEKHGDTERLALLRKRLQPFMLRRTKAAVAHELPPKVEAIEHIELAPEQANLYEMVRVTTEAEVRHTLEAKGLARSHITVLDALLKLRQVCCDPQLLKLDAARAVQQSAKMDWLVDNLPALIADGRRVLVFSAFSSMLGLIEAALKQHTDLSWVKLTGQSKQREALIARFTSGEVPLFLISLKAGGVGLNLPQADTVIHVDPWWNPAAEDQATDRAHRIGQHSTVFVYKLVAQGTLEERIVAMQARKAALAEGLHGEAGAAATRLTEEELGWLLQPIGVMGR